MADMSQVVDEMKGVPKQIVKKPRTYNRKPKPEAVAAPPEAKAPEPQAPAATKPKAVRKPRQAVLREPAQPRAKDFDFADMEHRFNQKIDGLRNTLNGMFEATQQSSASERQALGASLNQALKENMKKVGDGVKEYVKRKHKSNKKRIMASKHKEVASASHHNSSMGGGPRSTFEWGPSKSYY
jgi:hypothetical protein